MKRKYFIPAVILTVAAGLLSFKQEKKIHVWMIGDSTMSVKEKKAYPETGWGMAFAELFNDNVTVDNKAVNGRSTLSFINEKRWDEVEKGLQAGDYLFIEFGHNDEKIDKKGVGTTLDEYKANLARFVLEARAKKAIPILMTPIARRDFKDGTLQDTHKGYPAQVKALADSLHVPMIDMLQKTSGLLSKMGEEPSITLFNYVDSGNVNYPTGKKDNTHLSPVGAKAIAGLAEEGVKELKLPLAGYFKK
jgi:lysophospholipase L1-like esterase